MSASQSLTVSELRVLSNGRQEDGQDNFDITVYEQFPGEENLHKSKSVHAQSNTEAVISSLQTLYSKLKQLQEDRNAAVQEANQRNENNSEFKRLSFKSQEHNPKRRPVCAPSKCQDTLESYFQHLKDESIALENNVREILKIIRSQSIDVQRDESPKPETAEIKPSVINRSQLKPAAPQSSRTSLKCSSSYRTRKISECHHFRLNMAKLPFVASTMPGKSFSVPANIQVSISSLKQHNPVLCSLVSSCEATLAHIETLEKYLQDVVKVMQDAIGNLTLECYKLRMQSVLSDDRSQLIAQQQKVSEISNNRNALLTCIHMLSDLETQLQQLKMHLNAFTASSAEVQNPKQGNTLQGNRKSRRTMKKSSNTRNPSSRNGQMWNNRKPWDDRVVIDKVPEPKLSVDSLQYRKLLNMALKRNGLRLLKKRDT